MRKSLNRLLFAWRYALKNFIFNPMRSFLLTIGFLGIFVVVILAFSMNDFFRIYYVNKLEEKYQSFDMVMNISSSGDARFFSISQMNLNDDVSQMIEDKAVFFEFDVLLETNQTDRVYVHVFSSSKEDLSKISTYANDEIDLADDEMIITKSFSETYGLNIDDSVSLFARETQKTFIIKDIIDDGHLFIENSIFIDKDESLLFFLSSLSPSLDSLPSSLLKNMYNFVYIDIKPEYSYDQLAQSLQDISQYEKLSFTQTIDQNAVDHFVSRNISIFSMMLSIVFVSILFVLQTTLLVYFNEKKVIFSQVHVLGGKKQFSLSLVLIEMFTFFMLSFVISIWVTNFILDFGINYLKINLVYDIQFVHLIYALITVLLFSVVMVVYYFNTFYQTSDVNHLKEEGREVSFNFKKSLSILAGTILLYILFEINFINQLFGKLSVIVQILLAIIFMFVFAKVSLRAIIFILGKFKEKNLLYYHLSMMVSKKAFKHYTSVILIAFLTIMLLIFTNGYMDIRSDSYRNGYQTDFILTHIVTGFDDVYDEIKELDHVEDSIKVGLYTEVFVVEQNQTISQLISIDQDQISTFFNLDINQEDLNDLDDESRLKILLPDRYYKLYGLEIGDQIDIYVNPTYKTQSFYISGFFEKQLGDLAFTNMHKVLSGQSPYQAIILNSNIDKNTLRDELLDLFSDQMIRITDVNQSMDRLIYEMERVAVYITVILSLIIGCFVIAMINHAHLLFVQVKSNYARLYVIGYSKKRMVLTLIKEGLITLIVFYVAASIGYIVIASYFSDLSILFGEYEPVKFSAVPLLYGAVIITLVFSVQYAIYIYQVLHIKLSEIIKSY